MHEFQHHGRAPMIRRQASRQWTKWLPAAIAPAVIAAGVVIAPIGATAAVSLPEKSADELLEFAATSEVRALSGIIEQTSQLGLPDISGASAMSSGSDGTDAAGSGIASALELLAGSHTARVYLDGPTNARIQIMDSLAERDIVRSGDDLWFYDSEDKAATHVTLPDQSHAPGEAHGAPELGSMQTPQQLADQFLTRVDATTDVEVGTNARVAGRTAYELVLSPRDDATLFESVSITVDSETGLALGVEVLARGTTEPAFRLAFSELTLETPDPALFDFSPPTGTIVTEQEPPNKPETPSETRPEPPFTTTGEGWTTIVEMPASELPAEFIDSPLLATATEAVSGGRLLSTSLVNVLLTDDGRLLAGSVTLDRLQDAAAGR